MEKKGSIKEMAKMAGVSPTTVQNVLRGRKNCMKEETYQKVWQILQENHYVGMAAPKLLNGKRECIVGIGISEGMMRSEQLERLARNLLQLEKENYKAHRYTIFHMSSEIEEVAGFFEAWPTRKIYLIGFGKEDGVWLSEKMGIPVEICDK